MQRDEIFTDVRDRLPGLGDDDSDELSDDDDDAAVPVRAHLPQSWPQSCHSWRRVPLLPRFAHSSAQPAC